jgi:uncharacterized 2Fe-2S/4Fe-4S cluster protein (DUF4445 family)
MKTYTVRLLPLGKEVKINEGTPLIDVLHEYGIEFPCGGKGRCGKCRVKVLEGEIGMMETHRQKLEELDLSQEWRLACMSVCTGPLTLEVAQFNYLILADESLFEFEPEEGFGIAVDVGTTTLVTQILDLHSARVLAVETALNPQIRYGADVISRITACLEGHGKEMMQIIRKTIGEMIKTMVDQQKVFPRKIVLVGNTPMQLIFSGEDVTPLSRYPFEVDDLGKKVFVPKELGWDFLDDPCRIVFMPGIGSFVGSDILAGIAATGLYKKEPYTALIDLGTNGEIVVGNKDRIVCTSTAAGPAFEGMNISMGMRAVTGAISSVSVERGKIKVTVIGNTEPRGICGSGLIDAVAVFRELGLIGIFGEILSGEGSLMVAGKVKLTQKDINEFQLAKAAIAAGLRILTEELSTDLSEVEEIYIAGGFGSYLNLRYVVKTGMIETEEEKIRKMGNTALIGAKMFLYENEGLLEEILGKTRYINLESNPDFQDVYIDKMIFS